MNQRDELFAYLLEREGFEEQPESGIPRRRDEGFSPPLSFAQERLWFLDQFEQGLPVYNGCKAVRLVGRLSVDVLTDCLNFIVRRHEVLRTTYPASEGNPLQRVAADCPIQVSVTELEHLGRAEVASAVDQLIRNEWLQRIDLSKSVPIRVRLARIDPTLHLLILTLHQIVFDSQSVAIFFRELWTAYEAKVHGKNPDLPPLPVQYGDFASWQRRRVSGALYEVDRQYWTQRLNGRLPTLNLPPDKPRPPVQGFEGSRLPILLPEALQLQLKDLSRENGVTLFVTLLAAFKTLLYRYTSQEDLLVGCPALNRCLPETEHLLGSFVNTLVLRSTYMGTASFRQALKRVRETCLGAFEHQEFPFEKLVEELQPARDMARSPIFQVMLAFQNTFVPALQLSELRAEYVDIEGGMTKFDLTLSLIDKKHSIAGYIEYSTALFHADSIARMARNFRALLDGIVANPDCSIATLPIMPDTELRQIVFGWNNTVADYPKDKCIHELFERQAERTPEFIAVTSPETQMTYRELNRRANQIAHYLRQLGVGPEKRVGLCVERSLDMVVGLLGILKAGGAYVPLDPAYPNDRLRFMLEDSGCAALLTQQRLIEDGVHRSSILGSQTQVVCLDRDWWLIAQHSDDNPRESGGSESLAYVTYTSGSTGRPKGVQVSHRSVVNCLWSIRDHIEFAAADVFLAVTTISFDIAALEMYLPLMTGAKLVLADREEASDGKLLSSRLAESGATAMQATPSGWKVLLEAGWRGHRGFKMLCGGEALSRALADRLLDGGASLWNLYGPTETTIWSTIERVEPDEGPVYIGRPIGNTQIYVLDANLQPVPIGVHGELYIGGDGVARGYLGRPELTAERLIPDPFMERPGSRLYRTGDRARYRPDGRLEFLGRLDHQVKIRGHRIELGEIEATLAQHAAVKENVVVARANESADEKDLIGYVVPNSSTALSVSDLRTFLRGRLPEYMIPAAFVSLDALPVNSSGKIDRDALPPPDGVRPELAHAFLEPRTEIEELIAQIWREVLKLERIGIHDNFFELGGHSLLATRVVARLRNAFSVDLPLRKAFELPTIAALAEYVDILRREQSGACAAPLVPAPRDRPIPLSFSQRRLWFLTKLHPALTAYNIPAAFRIHGKLKIAALEQAVNEVVHRHEILRTAIVESDGEPFQQILSSATLTLSTIDLSELSGAAEAELDRLMHADARQPYNLAQAPLIRATLVTLGEKEHVLILNFHHIVADGSSLIVFYQELAAFYEGFAGGTPPRLEPLPIQYADYAVWQNEQLERGALNAEIDYWKAQLATGSTPAELPADYDRPTVQTFRGARLSRAVSQELSTSIKALSRREGVTVFMTLLAALDILIARYTGRKDVIVGSTIAGRSRRELERLIGFFINALPLRTELSGNPSFTDLLKRVREVCLQAYTHQDAPFDRIVEQLNPERDLRRQPLFQVMFNMVDVSERILYLSGCETTKLATPDPDVKFDITLLAPESEGKIHLSIVYNIELFTESRMVALLEQFEYVLRQAVENPERAIKDYSLVTNSALPILPDPTAPLDATSEEAIHELFSKQARRESDRPAVEDREQLWTYGELEARSSQLAHDLLTGGIRRGDVIAIYAHRSSPVVLALLGVLKAGAAFLILDPANPAARSRDYLRIARPKGWIAMAAAGRVPEELSSWLDSGGVCCRIQLPSRKQDIEALLQPYSSAAPAVTVSADDTAYLAFTSGSTGLPKGVVCRHGPMTHFLPWQEKAFQLTREDRFCLLSGLAYNHLHRDVFTALALGAPVFIPDAETLREPRRLTDWINENGVTVLHLTPALGRLLQTAGARLPSVSRVFFGGDVLKRADVAKIQEIAPNATIGIFYGATETQRAVGYYEISHDIEVAAAHGIRAIPLGRGIPDVQLLLLSEDGRLAGIGEVGELYVRSPHLAKGYVIDDGAINNAFIINPFTDAPEDKLYRTGELGRYLPDGNIEWAGRNDRCVNIRGFRVELAEIESALGQHPAVKEAAVIAKEFTAAAAAENPATDSRLVAYVASDEEPQSLTDLLRSFLALKLPEHMLPAHFVILDRLPLSPNGKVDYSELPEPVRDPVLSRDDDGAPRNEVETTLISIFRHVLGLEHVSTRDDFFRLGGHSLLAAQAASRIGSAFGLNFELRVFLESPNIAALAKRIQNELKAPVTTPGTEDTAREEIEL